jgi:hypothetical protein
VVVAAAPAPAPAAAAPYDEAVEHEQGEDAGERHDGDGGGGEPHDD